MTFCVRWSPARQAHSGKVVEISYEIVLRPFSPSWPQAVMAVMTDRVEAVFFSTFLSIPWSPFSTSFFCVPTAPWLPRTTHLCSLWLGLTSLPRAGLSLWPHSTKTCLSCISLLGALCSLCHCNGMVSEELTLLGMNRGKDDEPRKITPIHSVSGPATICPRL